MATPDHEHQIHPPHLSAVDVVGLIGLLALGFALGCSTAPGSDCSGRLQQAQMDLLLCQTKTPVTGLAEAPGTL